jgi:IS30 family transposase
MKEKKGRTFKRLSLLDVQQIFLMQQQNLSVREIGRTLRRSASTVSRVLNKYRPVSELVWLRMNVWERARYVYVAMRDKAHKGGNRGRLRSPVARAYVIAKLTDEHWSPEQIAGRISQDLPGVSITAKTIYNFIKHEREELQRFLKERGKKRRQRVVHRRGRFKQAAPTKRTIEDRPARITQRSELGHWEADLIVSCRSGFGAILSLTERVSRKKIFRRIPDTRAKTVYGVLWAILEELPPELRKSLTLDNGSEFAFSVMTGLEAKYPDFRIYYCDPYAPWQKGTCENSNRDFRWYAPKGTNFGDVMSSDVATIESRLARRPLKCLGFKTSDEYLALKLAA